MLTRKQHDLLLFIDKRLKEKGVSPSFDEMKEALGLKSKSGIHRLITALEERGFIQRLPHKARALEVVRLPQEAAGQEGGKVVTGLFKKQPVQSDLTEIPLHGKIAAGTPIEALENVDRHIAMPPDMLGRGSYYALEVSGDSMIDEGIMDGDTVLIERCENAQDGQIVVALVDENEATLKRLRRRGPDVHLIPANSEHKTQVLAPNRVRVQGRLVGLLRRY